MSIGDQERKSRSVSQYNSYIRCAYRYKLERIDKVWQRPASWLSQGLGVHKAMEEWELSGRSLSEDQLIGIYQDEFIRSVNEQAEITPNYDYWFGSGPYSGPVDIERRFKIGADQLKALVKYSVDNPQEEIWITPDGTPAVEIEFNVELGGVPVRGFIDQVITTPKGLRVRDIKTGAKPGDTFQLATYAEALRILYGVEVNHGDYFMGKTGKPTKPYEITSQDREEVHKAFAWLDEQVNLGEFPPNPSKSNCFACSVRTSCEFSEI